MEAYIYEIWALKASASTAIVAVVASVIVFPFKSVPIADQRKLWPRKLFGEQHRNLIQMIHVQKYECSWQFRHVCLFLL